MRKLFTSGIYAMLGLIGFSGGYLLKFFIDKTLTVGVTMVVVAAAWIKMLEIRDQIFR
jgi:hypothetical protein